MKETWEKTHMDIVFFDEQDSVLLGSGGAPDCATVCQPQCWYEYNDVCSNVCDYHCWKD